MTGTYAPHAIEDLFTAVKQHIPSAQLGGIVGDLRHIEDGGYHISRDDLLAHGQSGDYSIQERLDKEGDGGAASALDVTLGAGDLQHTVSQRLLDAKDDPRMKPIREFYGSVDGVHTIGWDWSRGETAYTDDMSHLWHIHLSVHRKWANDAQILLPVADVLAGIKPEEDMTPEQTQHMIENALRALVTGSDVGHWNQKNLPGVIQGKPNGIHDRLSRLENKVGLPSPADEEKKK